MKTLEQWKQELEALQNGDCSTLGVRVAESWSTNINDLGDMEKGVDAVYIAGRFVWLPVNTITKKTSVGLAALLLEPKHFFVAGGSAKQITVPEESLQKEGWREALLQELGFTEEEILSSKTLSRMGVTPV